MSKKRARRKGTLKGYLKRFNQETLKPRSQTDNSRLSTWAIADVGLRRNQVEPWEEFQGNVSDALMQEKPPRLIFEPSPQWIRDKAKELKISESEVLEQLKLASDEKLAAMRRRREIASVGRQSRGWRDWIKEYECVILQKLRHSKTFLYSKGDNFYIVVEDYLAQTIMKTYRYGTRDHAVLAFRLKNLKADVREKL